MKAGRDEGAHDALLLSFPGKHTVSAKKKANGKTAAAGGARRRGSRIETAASLPKEEQTRGTKKPRTKPEECQDFAKVELAAAWPAIVRGFVHQAKQGSYNHAKFIVEFSGLKEERKKSRREATSRTLSQILMKQLEMDGMRKHERDEATASSASNGEVGGVDRGAMGDAPKEGCGEG